MHLGGWGEEGVERMNTEITGNSKAMKRALLKINKVMQWEVASGDDPECYLSL